LTTVDIPAVHTSVGCITDSLASAVDATSEVDLVIIGLIAVFACHGLLLPLPLLKDLLTAFSAEVNEADE